MADDVDARFVTEEITLLVKESIDSVIGTHEFNNSRTPEWSTAVADSCIAKLSKLNKPFKYTHHFEHSKMGDLKAGCEAAKHSLKRLSLDALLLNLVLSQA